MNLHKSELNLCIIKSLARLQRQQMIYNALSEILPDRRARLDLSYFNHELEIGLEIVETQSWRYDTAHLTILYLQKRRNFLFILKFS